MDGTVSRVLTLSKQFCILSGNASLTLARGSYFVEKTLFQRGLGAQESTGNNSVKDAPGIKKTSL